MGTKKDPRLSAPTLKVLRILMSRRREKISGAEIARTTGLASGTLYPILLRLEDAGWANSIWEDGDPRELGRPRRRLYHITGEGARKTRAAFRELVPSPLGSPVWQH